MTDKRRVLGRGLGALIPTHFGEPERRPSDIFFPEPVEPVGDVSRETGMPPGTEVETTTLDSVRDSAPQYSFDPSGQDGSQADHQAVPVSGLGYHDAPDMAASEDAGGAAAAVIEGPRHAVDSELAAAGDGDQVTLQAISGVSFAEIRTDAIQPNPRQPRANFDEDDLAELAHSISEIGMLQPVVVRPGGPDSEAQFELVVGERRWRAAILAGWTVVPAIIKHTPDDALLRDALLENLHRAQLNPLEEAAAYQQLLEDFACTHDDLADRLGRSRSQVSNTIRLLRLPPSVARRVAAGVLSAGHARALLGLADGAAMERLAQRIVAEGMSVRAVEEAVALGEVGSQPARAARRAEQQPAELADVAAMLADRLDTKVHISLGRRKGRMTVEFASVEDLERIVTAMGANPADLDTGRALGTVRQIMSG